MFVIGIMSRTFDNRQNIRARVRPMVDVGTCLPQAPPIIWGFKTEETVLPCGVVLEPTAVDWDH